MSWLTCSWSTFHRKSLKVTDQPRWQQVFPMWTPYDGDPHWPSKKSLRVALKKWKFQRNGSHSPTKNAGNSSHETERIKKVYPIATKTKRHFYSFLCSANVCSHVSKRMGMDPLVSSSLIQAWALWVRKKCRTGHRSHLEWVNILWSNAPSDKQLSHEHHIIYWYFWWY